MKSNSLLSRSEWHSDSALAAEKGSNFICNAELNYFYTHTALLIMLIADFYSSAPVSNDNVTDTHQGHFTSVFLKLRFPLQANKRFSNSIGKQNQTMCV